ncbi:MAG: hypothetical protein QM689_06230 [Oscillospiraceae bacterium]
MKRGFIACCAGILTILAAGAVIGVCNGWWDFSLEVKGILGLAAVLPAVLWTFFGGLGACNLLLYLLGTDYILWQNGFYSGAAALVAAFCAVAVLVTVFVLGISRRRKKRTDR